jgi:LysR family transcriptional regulator, nitrogen assimilation regulatory protein
MSIEVLQLRLFLEVVAAGSVSGAARRVNIVQSALSRRMQMLEYAVGSSIFLRHTDGIHLTKAGQRLQHHAERILAEYDKLEEEFGRISTTAPREIKLGITKTAASFFTEQLVIGIHNQLPDIRMRVVEGTSDSMHEWLLSREIDFALMTSWRASTAFEFLPLWRETLFVVMPPETQGDFAAAVRGSTSLPFILTNHSEGILEIIERLSQQFGRSFRGGFDMDALPSIKRMVRNSAAFTLLPYHAISEEIELKQVRAFPLPDFHIVRHIVRRTGTPLLSAGRHFTSILSNVLLQQPQDSPWCKPLVDANNLGWSPHPTVQVQ